MITQLNEFTGGKIEKREKESIFRELFGEAAAESRRDILTGSEGEMSIDSVSNNGLRNYTNPEIESLRQLGAAFGTTALDLVELLWWLEKGLG